MIRRHIHTRRFGLWLTFLAIALGLVMPQVARADDPAPPATPPQASVFTNLQPTMIGNPAFVPPGTTQSLVVGAFDPNATPVAAQVWHQVTTYKGSLRDMYVDSTASGPCPFSSSDDWQMGYHCGAKVPVLTILFYSLFAETPIVTIGYGQPNADGAWPAAAPTISLPASIAADTSHYFVFYPNSDVYRLFAPGYVPWAAYEPANFWDKAWVVIRFGASQPPAIYKLLSSS